MTKEERLAALKALKEIFENGQAVLCSSQYGEEWQIRVSLPESLMQELQEGTNRSMYKSNLWDCIGVRTSLDPAFEDGLKWVQAEIAKMEQPPFDPKEVIEAAAADQEGMDAAESLLDREQMRRGIVESINSSPFQLTAALNHLYKALDAGYAKDQEIARLSRCESIAAEMQADIDSLQEELANYSTAPLIIEDLVKDLEVARSQCAAKDQEIAAHRDEIRALNGVIKLMEKDFAKMEQSRDEYKRLYQEALAAAEAQRLDLETKLGDVNGELASRIMSYQSWERHCLNFAVREGDSARVMGLNKWVYGYTVERKGPLEVVLCRKDGGASTTVDTEDIGKDWDCLYGADSFANSLNAAGHPWVQPAPVRLPVAGDTIEVLVNRNLNLWTTIAVDSQAMWSPMKMPSMEDYGKTWRWPEPRTRTAADAKVDDPIWFKPRGYNPLAGYIDSVYECVIWGVFQGEENRICLGKDDFGLVWGYAEEHPK